MYLSAYKYSKVYVMLWLLLATSSVAFGEEKSSAMQHKADVHNVHLQKNSPATWAVPPKKTLTTAQQQWLSNACKAKDSDKKRFKKLLANIGHKEAHIRQAACQMAQVLLTDNLKLAKKKESKYLKKMICRAGSIEEMQEAVQLLCTLVRANARLASDAASTVLFLTKNERKKSTNDSTVYDLLTPLIQTLIDQSPEHVKQTLNGIHLCARCTPKQAIVDKNRMTTTGLFVAEQFLHTDVVQHNPGYLAQILDIVLDGASVSVPAYKEAPVRNEALQTSAQRLLKIMQEAHPDLVQDRYHALTSLVQNEMPNMLAMSYLIPIYAVDPRHVPVPFELLASIIASIDKRVSTRAERIFRENSGSSTSGQGLTGLVVGLVVNKAFEGTEKRLSLEQAKIIEDHSVGIPSLRLLQEILLHNPSYTAETLNIVQNLLKDDQESTSMKKEALDTLACVVTINVNEIHTPKAIDIGRNFAQHKEAYIREAALNLLDTVLTTDDQYAKDQEILASIKKLSQDKHVKVRQLAGALLAKYMP